MSLEITRMRLESLRTRVLDFIDNNLESWAQDEILVPTQQLAWTEGLSENAIGTIQIEKEDFLKVKLVWDLFGPNDEPLSIWLEEGTKEHIIEAKGKLAGGADSLMWYGRDGRPIFRRKVKHPGTVGKHIIQRGLEVGRVNLRDRISRETREFLRRDKIGNGLNG